MLDPFTFPGDALAGRGSIAGTDVRCESPEWAVRWRTGYAPRPNDLHDVPLLCARFGDPAPGRLLSGARRSVLRHAAPGLQPAY